MASITPDNHHSHNLLDDDVIRLYTPIFYPDSDDEAEELKQQAHITPTPIVFQASNESERRLSYRDEESAHRTIGTLREAQREFGDMVRSYRLLRIGCHTKDEQDYDNRDEDDNEDYNNYEGVDEELEDDRDDEDEDGRDDEDEEGRDGEGDGEKHGERPLH